MRFRNAFRVLMNNFGNVYKLLLFRLAANVIFLSLAYVVISFGLHVVFSSEEAQRVVELFGEFFVSLFSGKTEFLMTFRETFTEAVTAFLHVVAVNMGSIVGSVVSVCLLYLLSRFVNGTAIFAMGSILNDKMETYGNSRFASAYFKNAAKATLYQVIYVPISFVYDVLSLLACWFFFFYTPSIFASWGIMITLMGLALSMTAFICLEALKMTFISAWIPSIVTGGRGVAAGMKESFGRFHGFAGRFSSFFIALYLIVIFNVLFGVCTFGGFLLVTVPASYLFLLALQFVYYYEDTGKKYFISFRKISGADGMPESMGD